MEGKTSYLGSARKLERMTLCKPGYNEEAALTTKNSSGGASDVNSRNVSNANNGRGSAATDVVLSDMVKGE